MRKFSRAFDKAMVHLLEPGGGEQLVEVDQHYETVEHLVGRMLEAGERLEAARASGFQFPGGVDTGEVDMTRSPGFDLADVTSEGLAVEARLESQAKAAKEVAEKAAKDAAEKAAAAQEAAIRAKIAAESQAAQK